MRTYSDTQPLKLLPLNDGNWHYHYNIAVDDEAQDPQSSENDKTQHEQWVYDMVFIDGEPTVEKIVEAVMLEENSDDQTLRETTETEAEEAINEIKNNIQE